jgi:hypothetical protein
MIHNLPLFPFLVIYLILAYRWFSQRRDGRPGIRLITSYGVAFCTASLGLWLVTRFEDVLASFPSPREASIFATPWIWVSTLCVGVALLVISFFTRVRHDHAA